MTTGETHTAGSLDALVRGRGIEHGDGTIICASCGGDVEWEPCDVCDGEGGDDGYELDPLWYLPGEIAPCPQCRGKRGAYWCSNSGCATTVIVELVKSPNSVPTTEVLDFPTEAPATSGGSIACVRSSTG